MKVRAVLLLLAAFCAGAPAHACAVCGEVIRGAAAGLQDGIFLGIIVFLAVPALLVVGGALLIRREMHRARERGGRAPRPVGHHRA